MPPAVSSMSSACPLHILGVNMTCHLRSPCTPTSSQARNTTENTRLWPTFRLRSIGFFRKELPPDSWISWYRLFSTKTVEHRRLLTSHSTRLFAHGTRRTSSHFSEVPFINYQPININKESTHNIMSPSANCKYQMVDRTPMLTETVLMKAALNNDASSSRALLRDLQCQPNESISFTRRLRRSKRRLLLQLAEDRNNEEAASDSSCCSDRSLETSSDSVGSVSWAWSKTWNPQRMDRAFLPRYKPNPWMHTFWWYQLEKSELERANAQVSLNGSTYLCPAIWIRRHAPLE